MCAACQPGWWGDVKLPPCELAHGSLVLAQRRNHSLPVAVAKFADQIGRELDAGWSLPPIDNRPMPGAAKAG